MENDIKNPVWKMLVGYIVVMMLLIVIACLSSCGSRKIGLDLQKNSVKESTEQNSSSTKSKDEEHKSESESAQVNDKVDETSETTTTTKFNESGKPIETITTTKTGKSTDKTKYFNREVKTYILHEIEKLKTITITIHEVKDYSKVKKTESNRNGLWWVAGVVLIVLVLVYFGYKYLTKPKI